MKVIILYRPNSEHARFVEEFVHDFTKVQPTRKVDLMDIDTKEGSAMASLYDMMQLPVILALDQEGRLLNSWQGEQLPLMNEVAYYAQG